MDPDDDDLPTPVHEDCVYMNFLCDRVAELRERGREATDLKRESEFQSGRAMAFYEVLDHMRNQAEAWGLDLAKLGLEDANPLRW